MEAGLESETLHRISARLSFVPLWFIEPSRPSLRPIHRTHQISQCTARSHMRPSTVFTIILTTLLTGTHPTFTLADSPASSTTDSQSIHAAFKNNDASGSSTPAAVSKGLAPDCEGKVPSNGIVTALLSRIVRSPSITQGKQCPIPPVPDTSPLEEFHP